MKKKVSIKAIPTKVKVHMSSWRLGNCAEDWIKEENTLLTAIAQLPKAPTATEYAKNLKDVISAIAILIFCVFGNSCW